MDESALQLKRMVYAALMAALTAAGAYIAIPIGPVPIVLQNLFVLLAGLLLAFAAVTSIIAIIEPRHSAYGDRFRMLKYFGKKVSMCLYSPSSSKAIPG